MKRRKGETKQEAIERVKKWKEKKRVERLLRFAYPRQHETFLYKKKLLHYSEFNTSVDLSTLKRESMRID